MWFTRFYFLLYSGHPSEALALVQERGGRPTGIPDESFDLITLQPKAVISRSAADIQTALTAYYAAARRAAGHAENAIAFAAYLGRIDDAFAFADAYFFGRVSK